MVHTTHIRLLIKVLPYNTLNNPTLQIYNIFMNLQNFPSIYSHIPFLESIFTPQTGVPL